MLLEKERTLVAEFGRKLLAEGLTRGTGGNLSVVDRHAGLAAVKPSAVAYPEAGLICSSRRSISSSASFMPKAGR